MPLLRRRPVLRAAAIGSGAYAAGKRRQEASLHVLAMEMLERLGKLHEQGVLTDEELASYKARLLNR